MSNLSKIENGAKVLQQVDVSEIFTSLAMGIAEAQKKLDDNSIMQTLKLADTTFGSSNKSLLELGFVPAFYSFTYADISASIHLKMVQKDDLSIGVNATLNLAKNKGYTEEESQKISESKNTSLLKDYKTSKEFSFKVKDSNTIKIENEDFKYNKKEDVKTDIRTYKESISEKENIDFVIQEVISKQIIKNSSIGIDVWMDNGFLRINEKLEFKKNAVGLLRITELVVLANEFDVNGAVAQGNFDNAATFKALIDKAKTANEVNVATDFVYGISSDGKFFEHDGSMYKEIPTDLYFKFNDYEVLYGTDLSYTTDGANLIDGAINEGKTKENHSKHQLMHQCLRFINNNDEGVKFTITGYTDPVGGNSEKNKVLAEKRALSMQNHIFTDSKNVDVKIEPITATSSGPSDLEQRKASIKLNNSYIIFVNGKITEAATPLKTTTAAKNRFVYTKEFSPVVNALTLDIEYGSTAIKVSNKTDITSIITDLKTKSFSHSIEASSAIDYLIHDESIVKHTVYSSSKESISIENASESTSEGSAKEDTAVISKDISESSRTLDEMKEQQGNNTFAVTGSVDFRMSKQFEMSVEGNSSMSARLVAVPPPSEFLEEVKSKGQ